MAIAFAQSVGSANNADTQDLAFASNVGAGSLLLASIRESGGDGAVDPVISDNRGGTWARVARVRSGSAGAGTISLWYAVTASAGACTVSFNGGSDSALRCTLHEFSGSWSSPVDGTPTTAFPSSSPFTTSSITPSQANALLFGVLGSTSDFTLSSVATGFTVGPDGAGRVYGAHRIVASSAAYDATFTFSGGGDYGSILAAFVESTPPSGPSAAALAFFLSR